MVLKCSSFHFLGVLLAFFSIYPVSSSQAATQNASQLPQTLNLLLLKGNAHKGIESWQGTATCLACHEQQGNQVFSSVHYQWLGPAPDMDNGPERQGKLDVGVNSYCINITGNWIGCASCHVGLGQRPESNSSQEQLENIDCLICHQENYVRKRSDDKFIPDTDQMKISIVNAAQTVHKPTRATCLNCHAKGGGGDNYKRGDLTLAHIKTTDRSFDVHMAITGGDMRCQSCHFTQEHAFAGRGSDIRPTELNVEIQCASCHKNDKGFIHSNATIRRHIARVACQTCHIPTYARNAADTAATEETEIHRDWRLPHTTASGAVHPTPTMAGNLVPEYRWWNGRSTSYLLFDQIEIDPETGNIPTSRPVGNVDDDNSVLYPFKYKTATQPRATSFNQLVALDTSVYFAGGSPENAIRSGLQNMGYNPNEAWDWVTTDTYQLITHEVMPAKNALTCKACHESTAQMDLVGKLGYQLKNARQIVCTQCHDMENDEHDSEDEEDGPEYIWIHREHVGEKHIACSRCHTFSRPERNS